MHMRQARWPQADAGSGWQTCRRDTYMPAMIPSATCLCAMQAFLATPDNNFSADASMWVWE